MLIIFGNNAVKKKCRNPKGKLKRRLDDIKAASDMSVLKTLPGRCHPLVEDRKGQWAIDLDHPLRLIFEPILDGHIKDGRLELNRITDIKIVGVENYHGK